MTLPIRNKLLWTMFKWRHGFLKYAITRVDFIFQWPCRIRCWESSYEQLYQKQERLAYHLQFLQELTTTKNHRHTFWPRSLL